MNIRARRTANQYTVTSASSRTSRAAAVSVAESSDTEAVAFAFEPGAAEWTTRGFDWRTAPPWQAIGVSAEIADWWRTDTNFTPEQVAVLRTHGTTPSATTLWIDEGFSEAVVIEWHETAKVTTATQARAWTDLGMTPRVVRRMAADVMPNLCRAMRDEGISTFNTLRWGRGYISEIRRLGLTAHDAPSTAIQVREWIATGMRPQEAARWKRSRFDAETALPWRAARFRPADAQAWKSASGSVDGDPVAWAVEHDQAGHSPAEAEMMLRQPARR